MLTRRQFLTRTTLVASAASFAPRILRSADKSGQRLPVTGQGAHTYEVLHDWLQPPAGLVWGDTHGLAQDADGFIYVAHTVHKSSMRPEAVAVFDAQGTFVRAFGPEYRGGAHGLQLRREGREQFLYHCDVNRCRTIKSTLQGEVVWARDYPVEDPAYAIGPTPYTPTNIAFAPDGSYYVADGYGSNRILRYDARGTFLSEIGRPGPNPAADGPEPADGVLHCPHGLYVDARGREPVLVVADRSHQRVQVFSLDGRHVRTVKDKSRLRLPCHFDVQGDLMVCPDLDSQVCLLDRDWSVIAQLGDGQSHNGRVGSRRSQARTEFTPGEFICPHGAIFLQNGDILVAEWLPIGRLTLLRRVAG
jgi:sugar lactone lactonase YvrE